MDGEIAEIDVSEIAIHPEPLQEGEQISSEIPPVLELLKPRKIETDDGITRTIYTFQVGDHPVEVMFYPHNETPFSQPEMSGKRLHVFGDPANARPDGTWEEYIKSLTQTDNPRARMPGEHLLNPTNFSPDSFKEGDVMFLVEQHPRALIDLVMALGSEYVEELRELRKLLHEKRTNDDIDNLIDALIATKLFDDSGEVGTYDPDDNTAEALAVRAMLGDEEAQHILDKKLIQLHEYDAKNGTPQKKELPELSDRERDVLDMNVAVHVTGFKPPESKDGEYWEVPTTFDARRPDHYVPRVTWHSSLNHMVRPSVMAMGSNSFDSTKYAIMCPLGTMMEQNGVPESISADDSFYIVNPGDRIRVPRDEGIIVVPGNPRGEDGVLFQYDKTKRELRYKYDDFDPSDIKQIVSAIGGNTWMLEESVRDVLYYRLKDALGVEKFESTFPEGELLAESFGGSIRKHNDPEELVDVIDRLATGDMEDVVEKAYADAGIEASSELVNAVCQGVNNILVTYVKDIAVKDFIARHRPDDYPMEEGTDVVSKLGVEYLGPAGHWNHYTTAHQDMALRRMGAMIKGKTTVRDDHYRPGRHYYAEEPDALRRMYYYMGEI